MKKNSKKKEHQKKKRVQKKYKVKGTMLDRYDLTSPVARKQLYKCKDVLSQL